MNPERLCILTPSMTPRSEYSEAFLRALDDATGGGLVRVWRRSNVAMARNEVTAVAYHRHPDRDLWLWLDDDEWCPLDDVWGFVMRALERFNAHGEALHNVLVGGVYAPKRRGGISTVTVQEPAWSTLHPVWAAFEGDMGIGPRCGDYYPADFLGGGAILHSRATLERMAERAPAARYGPTNVPGWQLWRNVVEADRAGIPRESGEDVGFCRAAQAAGIGVWLDTRWVLTHEGITGFRPGDCWHDPEVATRYPRPQDVRGAGDG